MTTNVCVSAFDGIAIQLHDNLFAAGVASHSTNFNHNLLYLLIWFHAHRPNVELSTGFSETERLHVAQAAGQEDSHNMVLPQCPADIVGGTFTFQLKLTDFNFLPKISLSRSHTYLIATSPYLFLILRIRFIHQLHFIGWVCHTWISYLNVVLFT
uniref:Uncharacterized protein n=1 Tax=Brassica oleracea TaxID=3712 RepID=A0A3P6F2W0_BRAOL|nr:unnamed protein product [Brassica oleracea]